jgi:hypothetical protein
MVVQWSRLRVQCRSALCSCQGQRDAERPEDRFDWRRGKDEASAELCRAMEIG